MSGEDRSAHQAHNCHRGFDHSSASCSAIAMRYLLRDWFQIRSKMNCIAAPCFVTNKVGSRLFPDVFVDQGKWFRSGLPLRGNALPAPRGKHGGKKGCEHQRGNDESDAVRVVPSRLYARSRRKGKIGKNKTISMASGGRSVRQSRVLGVHSGNRQSYKPLYSLPFRIGCRYRQPC